MTVENRAPLMKRSLVRLAAATAALVTGVCLSACSGSARESVGPPEKVTIALSATTDAVLADVALVKGLFTREGLDVAPRLHPYGKLALADLLSGKADFATVAETPVMFAIMGGEKIAVIATIQASKVSNAILARRDRGITGLRDLRGKRIAATLGTTSDFYLDAILGIHEVSRKDVAVVGLKAEEMPDALERGDVDAVSVFTPYVTFTQKKLGHRAVTFQDRDIYRSTFNVVATREFIRRNPGKVRKVLRALLSAEEFVMRNPEEAQKIVSDFIGIEPGIVRGIWAGSSFSVTLDQSLILALEDESEWAIRHGLTKARQVPNYLDSIYIDGLNTIRPNRVRILR